MVYCEIATRTLDTRLRVIKAGTEGGQGSEEVPITCHGHRTLPSHAAKIVRQLLTFVKKFGLEHPKLKQSGEQEEPLFMALIVKENLPLSTHRRPYLRFSEEARGPSGQSQLQPAQMRIDLPTGIRLFSRPRIETGERRTGAIWSFSIFSAQPGVA